MGVLNRLCAVTLFLMSFGVGNAATLRSILPISASEPMVINKKSDFSGFMPDFYKLIAGKLGMDVSFYLSPRKRVDESLVEGSQDIVCSHNPLWTPMKDQFDWSAPVLETQDVVVSKRPSKIKSIVELKGQSIGLVKGFFYPIEFEKFGIKPESFKDEGTQMRALLAGRVQNAFVVDFIARYWKARGEEITISQIQEEKNTQYHCAISRKFAEKEKLLKVVNENAGEMRAILEKYMTRK